MIQACVWLENNRIVGQFYANSSPVGKQQTFSSRDYAELFMSKAFKRDIAEIRKCWVGTGLQQVLYVTRYE